MPLTFLNGGGPDYLGATFSTAAGLLQLIHDNCVLAGMQSVTNTPVSNLIELRFLAKDNADTCAIRFTTSVLSGTVLRLTAVMSHSSAFSINSQDFRLQATLNQPNKLWLTADQDHLAMCIQNFSGTAQGLHAGYLLRLTPADTFAFAIGIPHTSPWSNTGFDGQIDINTTAYNLRVGRDYTTGSINWFAPAVGFFRSNQATLGGMYPAITVGGSSTANIYFGQGFLNRHANSPIPLTNAITSNTSNPGYNSHIGNVNGLNNKTIIGEYYFIEGATTDTGYTTGKGALAQQLSFRGVVQSVVVGVSHLLDAVQVQDVLGQRYISTGGLGRQGIRIL